MRKRYQNAGTIICPSLHILLVIQVERVSQDAKRVYTQEGLAVGLLLSLLTIELLGSKDRI